MSVIKMRLLTIISLVILSSCSSIQEEVDKHQNYSPKELFLEAKDIASELAYQEAISVYEKILARYPASKYALQSKLEIPYVLYKADRHNEAIVKINEYIKLYPNNDATPYAYYLRAVIVEDKAKSMLDEYNITDRANRDVDSVRQALNYYITLIKKFPNSKYSEEAKSKIIILRNVLARHELIIAIFYTKHEAYISAINRCKFIIENYENTPSTAAALHLMAHNYKELQQDDLANDTLRVLNESYPKYIPHYSLN